MEEKYCVYNKLGVLFDQLTDIFTDNRVYFVKRKKSTNQNFVDASEKILNIVEPMKITMEEMSKLCQRFDVDNETKGNGFRSLMCITEKCLFKVLEIGIYIQKSRDRFFFRSYHSFMELESYANVATRLFTIMQVALGLNALLQGDSLFADDEVFPEDVHGLMQDIDGIERECFYGRSFGFQFSPAMQQCLHMISVALAAYGDGFQRHNDHTARALSSVLHSGKYVVDPELRAKRIVELTRHVSIPFCKAFWSLPENHGIQHFPKLICPTVAVNKELEIAVKPLKILTSNGLTTIDPCFMSSPKTIHARLLSYVYREGQGNTRRDSRTGVLGGKSHGLSKNLLLHCHGGGFVAQSSKAHEIYLRNWTKELQCPILSIDYSLSPDAPYPEALNECFYTYVWAMFNAKSLGWTGERICLAGDSAGANLMVALTLKLIQEDIRLPNGIVVAYPPLLMQMYPSPSRMLTLMDPLLPPGILKVCVNAYAGDVHEDIAENTTGSSTSLRTPVYGDLYNPFDVDLGDVAYDTQLRKWSDIAGKRSFSDTNLIMRDHYCIQMSNSGCLRCKRKTSENVDLRQSRDNRESEGDDGLDGLQMRRITQEVPDKLKSNVKTKELAMKDILEHEELSHTAEALGDDLETQPGEMLDPDKMNMPSNISTEGSSISTVETVCPKKRANTVPHHRRSLSDSIAESFRRLRANSVDSPETRNLSDDSLQSRLKDSSNSKSDAKKCGNKDTVNSGKLAAESSRTTAASSKEFRAIYIKETSDLVIVDRDNSEWSCSEKFEKVEKIYESEDSDLFIPNPVRRKCKDPLMSPLLASDDLLKKLPKLVIVACAFDPLLDDSVDFIRRLKKLKNDAEIFIVEDLPHGFLNLNFASSEAKEASELLIACIKRVLNVGIKHENSFAVSPDAGGKET